jgi:putative intracellular protease/amidase
VQIVIPLFDRFTALDAVGPYQVLSQLPGAKIIFASERRGVIPDDSGALGLRAEAALADVSDPDIVLVPGGPGQADQMGPGSLILAGATAAGVSAGIVSALRAASRFREATA